MEFFKQITDKLQSVNKIYLAIPIILVLLIAGGAIYYFKFYNGGEAFAQMIGQHSSEQSQPESQSHSQKQSEQFYPQQMQTQQHQQQPSEIEMQLMRDARATIETRGQITPTFGNNELNPHENAQATGSWSGLNGQQTNGEGQTNGELLPVNA